jgi:condensin complex subunit 2
VQLRMRRRTPVDGEPDAAFWAPTAGMVEDDEDMGGMGEFHFDDDGPSLPPSLSLASLTRCAGSGEHAPFETQFFHDDEDIPDFEEEEDGAEEDLLAATQGQLKRVRPEEVNYAKRAKRVDVKKLKDSIWKELEEVTIAVKEVSLLSPPSNPRRLIWMLQFPSAAAYAREEDSKSEALVPVISGLRKLYPKDKMEEISTSFCFICLLHLANEKGLRIQTPESEEGGVDDGLSERASVGGLDRLRVFRELVV